MVIKINHLGYKILIKNPTRKEFVAYVERDNKNQCTLYIKRPVKFKEVSTLAHEVVHILQYIAEARNLDMIQEQEHMGYLMNYIMNEVLGFEYNV